MTTQRPKYATVDNWTALSGLGRSSTYYLLAQQKLRAIKAGRRTLIDVDHGLAWLAAQPIANITCKRKVAT